MKKNLLRNIPSFLTYYTPCSSVSIVNVEHVIAGWSKSYSVISDWHYARGPGTIARRGLL